MQLLLLTAAPAAAGGTGSFMFMIAAMLIVFYLLIWRPQSKQARQHRELLSGLAKGDEVVTSGGLVGRVSKISDSFVVLAVSENVEITVQKPAVATVLPKGTLKTING